MVSGSAPMHKPFKAREEDFLWRGKGHRIAKTILKERNGVRGLTLSNFKTYHKARKCGCDKRADKCINGTKYRAHK